MSRRTSLVVAACLLLAAATAPVLAEMRAPRFVAWEAVLRGDEAEPLHWPVALSAGPGRELAVLDRSPDRLCLFSERDDGSWVVLRSIPLPAPPVDVAYDGNRYLISLRGRGELLAVEGERHQLRPVPLPQGRLAGPLAAVDGGGFLVGDPRSSEVLALDVEGRPGAPVRVDGQLSALAAAPGGGFYAAFPVDATIRRFAADGSERGRWDVPGVTPAPAWPVGLVVEPGGEITVLDRHGGRLVRLDAAGRVVGTGSRRGWDPGLLRLPAALAPLGGDRLAVADLGNGRVQVFRILAESDGP